MRVQKEKPILFMSAHLKRRPTARDNDRAHWIRTLLHLLRDVPNHQRIINVDESCWYVHPDGLQTCASTRSQNIQAFCNGDEKDSFTVVAAITAARTKLLLTLMATGKPISWKKTISVTLDITALTIQSSAGQPLALFSGGWSG
jgi:hypothetical protein